MTGPWPRQTLGNTVVKAVPPRPPGKTGTPAIRGDGERIQKMLANAGLGSRRQLEAWIKEGKVRVNGRVAGLGDRISSRDRVSLNGRTLVLKRMLPTQMRVIAYYKPAGEICSSDDPEHRKTVFSALPRLNKGRWINIGRLDINTTGLLLFTNNGELANRLMHPSHNVEREYAVRVIGRASAVQLETLKQGILLDGVKAGFTTITDAGGEGINHWYHVIITEGRNREVRRLWESQGLTVSRLIRVRYGAYALPRKKRPGQVWELDEKEIGQLLRQAGME